MTSFPTIQAPTVNGLDAETIYKQLSNETDAGYKIRRNRSLRSRDKFSLSWEKIPEIDYISLETFFKANRSTEFTWTHPVTSVAYTVCFTETNLKSNIVNYGVRKVSCEIEEV